MIDESTQRQYNNDLNDKAEALFGKHVWDNDMNSDIKLWLEEYTDKHPEPSGNIHVHLKKSEEKGTFDPFIHYHRSSVIMFSVYKTERAISQLLGYPVMITDLIQPRIL